MGELGFLGWIIIGGLAGWVAGKIMGTDKGVLATIVVGIIGGFLGGFLVNLLGGEGVTGFNLWSFVVAVIGAVVLIWLWRLVSGGTNRTP